MRDNPKMSKMNLDALNILKGLAISQLHLEDERNGLVSSGYFNEQDVFKQIDRKMTDKVYPHDIINFLGVHRIATNERECQYLIWLAGSKEPFLSHSQFIRYLTNGQHDYLPAMQSSGVGSRLLPSDQLLKNNSQRQVAKMFEKEIEYYRTIQKLREDFVKQYGFQFNAVINQIDKQRRGNIDVRAMVKFTQENCIQFSLQQFEAISRKVRAKDSQILSYKQLMRAFSPFQPLNFPTYRKQSNLQKAMDHINQQVKLLDIDTYTPFDEDNTKKTKTGFQKVVDQFRNPKTQGEHLSSKYFYDKNYYNELRQYKATYYDPNKDVKKKVQTEIVGPQYHDHFFADYYLYLEQRNKTEHYYNKFGKRYAFENPIAKTLDFKH